jgi:hypothetical protein
MISPGSFDPDVLGSRLGGRGRDVARRYPALVHRVFSVPVASVYPHYVTKVERKGRTTAELDEVIEWLTGFDDAELHRHLDDGTTFEDFFADAELNPNASLIKGVICGVRVEDIDDPLMQKLRYLDKLVDELAKGKAMEKILRNP